MLKLDILIASIINCLLITVTILLFGCGDERTNNPGLADAGTEDAGADAAPVPSGPGVETLAGAGEPGRANGPGDQARFHNPVNVAVGPEGSVYVADFDNHWVRRVTPDGVVSTVPVELLGFGRPFGLALGPDGALYIQTDYSSTGGAGGALWVLDPGGDIIRLVMDNIGKTRGLVVLPDGRLIGANISEHVLLLIDPETGEVSELAGARGEPGYQDGTAGEARLNTPYDLVLIEPDVVLVSDRANHRLRRVTLDGEVTTMAGTGEAQVRDGDLAEAAFHAPQGLAVDAAGTIYVASVNGYVIHRIAGDMVEVIAGDGSPGYRDDPSDPLAAQFFGMEGIDVTPDGETLYIADGNRGEQGEYHRLRMLSM